MCVFYLLYFEIGLCLPLAVTSANTPDYTPVSFFGTINIQIDVVPASL